MKPQYISKLADFGVFLIRRNNRNIAYDIIEILKSKSKTSPIIKLSAILEKIRIATEKEFFEIYPLLPNEWKPFVALQFNESYGCKQMTGVSFNKYERIFWKAFRYIQGPKPSQLDADLAKIYEIYRRQLRISSPLPLTHEEVTLYRGVGKTEAQFAREKKLEELGVWWACQESYARLYAEERNKEGVILVTKVNTSHFMYYWNENTVNKDDIPLVTRAAVIFPEEIPDFSVSIID